MKPTNNAVIEEFCQKLCETIKKKNADYDNAFAKAYDKFGGETGALHIYEKTERIIALTKGEAQTNESLDDALMDCAGYCLLYLDQRHG